MGKPLDLPSSTREEILSALCVQGRLADAMLSTQGIKLTQGGEPTFVPAETFLPEWNLEALGEEKLSLAWKLCRELGRIHMPGAVILRSNGKHYPGEPIPRWKLTLLRKPQATPLWKNHSLLTHGKLGKGRPIAPRKFLSELAARLGISGSLRPAYEDIETAMRNAQALGDAPPLPRYSRSKKGFIQPRWTTSERRKWQSLHKAAGWLLPLSKVQDKENDEKGWITADWSLPNGEELLLLPGTSSIGLRLPLHRLTPGTLSCALTAEIREGALSLFLPPLPDAASFAELLAVIEATAVSLKSPALTLEGYPPPHEEGWESLSVIPDPGVIEVNLPPAADWDSLESTVTALYAAAEKVGLKGTRLLPSGEVVPTGGGGHLVLGGESLESNPFLLKPAMLSSFLRFIQRHPSLSYLFSGRFMGPSSQAPRIDESFFEIPRELERALRSIEQMDAPANPALIDATLRNLLLDLHGNTHRAEVSIDKFFNSFMPNGQLGLVEFRSIEMSPDAPSFLAIHALWRALAASFAAIPYTEPLIDWQGKLHDHFLLPTMLEENLKEALQYLRRHGFGFEMAMFRPHLDFRFPILAEEMFHETSWSIRRAAEPWPLLGEQPSTTGGLIRCVDSSTERLEIRIHGKTPLSISINERHLPLAPHHDGGWVGAVRFRTLSLPTCLHPLVEPHTPLEIDLHDPTSGKRCAWLYHPHAFGREGNGPAFSRLQTSVKKPLLSGSTGHKISKHLTLDLMGQEQGSGY
jgi:uncharacterized protein (DUF2126 family)